MMDAMTAPAPLVWSPPGPMPGQPRRALLIHGLSSLAHTWWRVGPALAEWGWEVTAINQAGHGGRAVAGPLDFDVLVDAALEQYPIGPDLLVGHSLGAVTALALVTRLPGWAATVVLEEPPGMPEAIGAEVGSMIAASVRANAAAVAADRAAVEDWVRHDCPRWTEEDVYWAVDGIAQMDASAFALWLEQMAGRGEGLNTAAQIAGLTPVPTVLAALSEHGFAEGGSALVGTDRQAVQDYLPPEKFLEIVGGHCLHRDDPAAWLSAVERAAESTG
jgi:pimeloyl-ACP methyl ester carboxylesterase